MPETSVRNRSASEMRQFITAQKTSGQSIRAFCQGVGLEPWTFSYWKARLGNGTPQSVTGFVEIKVKSKVSAQAVHFKVTIQGSIDLEVPPDFDKAALRSLVAVLKSC